MTKSELINILNSEKQRLSAAYTKPGWTVWAIIGSFSGCIWLLLGLLESNRFDYEGVIPLYLIFVNILLFFSGIESNNSKSSTVYKEKYKGINDIVNGGTVIFVLTILYFVGIIVLCSRLMIIKNWCVWLYGALNSIYILFLIFAIVVARLNVPFPQKKEKTNIRIEFISRITFTIIPVIPLIVTYYSYVNLIDIKYALLLFALTYLLNLFIGSKSSRDLSRIDELIERAVYEENPNTEAIFKELEVIVIGIKISGYFEKYFIEYEQIKNSLGKILEEQNILLEKFNQEKISFQVKLNVAESLLSESQNTSVYYIKLKDVFEKIILESKRLSFFLNNDPNFQSEMVRMIDIAKKHRDETTELIKLSNPAIDAVRDFLNEVNGLLKISKCELCAKYPLYKVEICEEECQTVVE